MHLVGLLRARRTICALAVGSLATACGDAAGPDPKSLLELFADTSAAFRTDQTEYVFRQTSFGHEATVGLTFTNSTGLPVYMVNCSGGVGWRLEKLVGIRWVHAYAPVMLACLSAPIVVPDGMERRFGIGIHAPFPESRLYPKFELSDLDGIYRVVWHGLVHEYELPWGPWSREVAERVRTSNAFRLRLGQ